MCLCKLQLLNWVYDYFTPPVVWLTVRSSEKAKNIVQSDPLVESHMMTSQEINHNTTADWEVPNSLHAGA